VGPFPAAAAVLLALALLRGPAPAQGEENPVGPVPVEPSAVEDAEGETPGAAGEELDEEFIDDLFDFEEEEERIIGDPLEKMNRGIFKFNDKVYFYLAKPVARAWRKVPEPARVSLGNFFSNIFAPLRAVNCLLQWKIDDFGNEVGRFMINTTVGVLGFSDATKRMTGIGPKKEDFGQTLGVWGFGQGFYLVIPFLGPSSARDLTGFVGEFFLDPIYYTAPERQLLYFIIFTGNYVNSTSLDKDTYESIIEQQIDPYTFVKNAYAQKREADVKK